MRCAQFAVDAAAFFFAHLIQPRQGFAGLRHHGVLNGSIGSFVGRVQRPGDAQHRIQIGLDRQRKLGGGSPERGDVSADDLAIERKRFVVRALQGSA